MQAIEVEVTNCAFLIAHRSALKRGPYGTEDDFVVPPPAKLPRIEEPKRGVWAPVA